MTEQTLDNQQPQVELITSRGTIVIELNAAKAPNTVANFLSYVDEGYYAGTIFHRVIPNFMAQGGGFTPDMQQKPTQDAVKNEADNGLKNVDGSIAMARTNDPHSATSQFFLNLGDNEFLNHSGKNPQGWGYTVFGQIIEGMDVLQQIGKVDTGTHGMHGDVPKEPIIIESAQRVGGDTAKAKAAE